MKERGHSLPKQMIARLTMYTKNDTMYFYYSVAFPWILTLYSNRK